MQTTIKGRHLELTEALKEHATNKLQLPAERVVADTSARMNIELHRVGKTSTQEDFEVRVHVTMKGGRTVNITETGSNMYQVIDRAEDRLLVQIKRSIERVA